MTAQTKGGIAIGDLVRSFDFEMLKDVEGPKACYIEGEVTGFAFKEGCDRYCIVVRRQVFKGKDISHQIGQSVFPPVNGTPTVFGGTTDFVVSLGRASPLQ